MSERWFPRVWPPNVEAADAVRACLEADGEGFHGIGLDFTGSDLTGFSPAECWATYADFSDCVLEDVAFVAAQATDTRFTRANLARAVLSKAVLSRSIFDDADLTSANLIRVEGQDTSFRQANLTDAVMVDADLRRADLSSANLTRCDLNWAVVDNAVFAGTTVVGASGIVRGAAVVEVSPERRVLDGIRLQRWFADRGASVIVEPSVSG